MNVNPEKIAETCHKLIKECKCAGLCCGPVSFPLELFARVKDKALKPYEAMEDGAGEVIPMNKEGLSCVFLKPDLSCNIYEERPEICRSYGSLPGLECPKIKPNGGLRSPADARRMQRIISHKIDETMKKIERRIGQK